MVNTSTERLGDPPKKPDIMQGATCNTKASLHEAKAACPKKTATMTGGTTSAVQEDKGIKSHITLGSSGLIPYDASGSPQNTPPPVVNPRVRPRTSPLGDGTAVQQDQDCSHDASESLASRKGLTVYGTGGLTLSTASTVVDDGTRDYLLAQQVGHDAASAGVIAASSDVIPHDVLETPTKPAGSSTKPAGPPNKHDKSQQSACEHDKGEIIQGENNKGKTDAFITELSVETAAKREKSSKGEEEDEAVNKHPQAADKQPQAVVSTTSTTTSDPPAAPAPAPSATAGADSSSSSAAPTVDVAALQAELATLRAQNDLATRTTAAAVSRLAVQHAHTARAERHARQSAYAARQAAHQALQSERLAARVHALGKQQHRRAQRLDAWKDRAQGEIAELVELRKMWKDRAEKAERENAEAVEEGEKWKERAEEAERENEELWAWARRAEKEGNEVLETAKAWRRQAVKVGEEVEAERAKAGKWRRAYDDVRAREIAREAEAGSTDGGENAVAKVAERVVGRIDSTLEGILEDVYGGAEAVQQKRKQLGLLRQEPEIFESLELATTDPVAVREREKEMSRFWKYAKMRGEFVKKAGIDATEEQFEKAMKMEAKVRREIRRLGCQKTKSV